MPVAFLLDKQFPTPVLRWKTASVGGDGRVFAAPYAASNVLVVEPNANRSYILPETYSGGGTEQYRTSVTAPNGRIYAAPYSATYVLVIDPASNSSSLMAEPVGGCSNYWSSTLANDGKIYAPPYGVTASGACSSKNTHHKVLVIDPGKNSSYTIGNVLGSSFAKWTFSILAGNGLVYALYDYGSDQILAIRPGQNTSFLLRPNWLSYAGNKGWFYSHYYSCAIADNGFLYCPPAEMDRVGVIEPTTNKTYTIGETLTRSSNGGYEYKTCALGPDGRIFAPPYENNKVLVIDPVLNTTYRIGSSFDGVYQTVALIQGNRMVATPYSYGYVMVIDLARNDTDILMPRFSDALRSFGDCVATPTSVVATPWQFNRVLVVQIPGTESPTSSPATQSPSTLSPFTLSPSSASPNTLAPSSRSPVTLSPATGAPTSKAPSTKSPVTASPVTASPSSSTPTTRGPTTLHPLTQSPTMEGPTAISAVLSDSVSDIQISFSRPVDPSISPNCNNIFTAQTVASLGEFPQCNWINNRTLSATLSLGFTLTLESKLSVAGGVIFGPGESQRTPLHAVALTRPANPPAVAVSVDVPSIVGACDLLVEMTASASGSAGKPHNFIWRFVRSDPRESSEFEAHISAYLNLSTHGAIVSIPGVNFSIGTEYWFDVTAINWLESSETTGFMFRKTGRSIPTLSLPSATSIVTKRSEPLDIRVQVRAPQCPGLNVPTLVTRGLWSQTQGPTVYIPDPSSVYLNVPAYSLDANTNYKFQIYVWTVDAADQLLGNVTETFEVTVRQEPVVARITGGASRTASIASTTWLLFDASPSYDPMYPTVPINYTWSVTPGVSLGNSLTSKINGSRLSLSPVLLSAGRVYTVTVVVVGALGRLAAADQDIATSNASAPEVVVNPSVTKHNPGEKLVLIASADAENESLVSLLWTCESQNFNMSNRSLRRSSRTGYNLVIAPDALFPGLTYTFRLTATSASGGVGQSSARIVANTPPALGSCSASPSSGTALQTRFRLGCSGWTDDDVPLLYKFQVASTGLDMCDFRQLEYYDTLLPSGEPQYRATVRDSYGGVAHSLFNVSVSETTQFDLSSVERERNERLAEGDTQAFGVLCAGTSAYLKSSTSVNTSTASRTRANLLGSIQALQNRSSAPVGSLVASLVESVTDYRDPKEITTGATRDRAIDILETVSESTSELSDDTIVASTTALANLLSAAANSGIQPPVNTTTAIESVLVQLSSRMLDSSVDGEDPRAAKARAGANQPVVVEMGGSVHNIESGGGFALAIASTKTTIEFPPLPHNLTSAPLVRLSGIVLQGSALFPYNASMFTPRSGWSTQRGGVVSIHVLNASGQSLDVKTNETHPFKFTVPRGSQELSGSDFKAFQCEYWDVASESWARDGVQANGIDEDGIVQCNSTHLTAFSSNVEFRVRVNTFSSEDLTIEAFDPRSNPVTALIISVVALFLVLLPLAHHHDRRMLRQDRDGASQLAFWRTMNRIRQEHTEGSRSAHNFANGYRWALRRRHPWLSVFLRHSGDYLTSRKRLMILLVLLLNMACVCALLMGNEQAIPFVRGGVAYALVACAFAFPLPYVFAKFFTRATPVEFRVKRDKGLIPGTVVGIMMTVLAICAGLDAVDEDADDQDGGDVEDDAAFDEKDDQNDDKDDERKLMGSTRGLDRDASGREGAEDKKSGLVGAVLGASAGSAIGRRSRREGKRGSLRAELYRDVRRSQGTGVGRRSLSSSGVELSDLKSTSRVDAERKPQLYMSHHILKPINGDGGANADPNPGLSSHQWSKKDLSGAVFLLLAACGCVFVLGMLSWTHRETATTVVRASLTSFGQDVLIRAILILVTEYLLVAPLCLCCCCICRRYSFTGIEATQQTAPESKYKTVELHGDRKALEFDHRARVTTIYRQARVRGVRVGMRIVAIDGTSISNGREAKKMLDRSHRIKELYRLTLTEGTRRGINTPRGHVARQSSSTQAAVTVPAVALLSRQDSVAL